MFHNFQVLRAQHLQHISPHTVNNVLTPPYQQHHESQHAHIPFPPLLRQNELRHSTLSHRTLGLGNLYAPQAYFDEILTHEVGAERSARQTQDESSVPLKMKCTFLCIRNAFKDDIHSDFLEQNLISLESEAIILLETNVKQLYQIENLQAQLAVIKVSQAKISQRCFMELWEDGIRQTDPEIYRVYGLPTYPTAANPFPRPTVYNRTFVWHRGMLVMPKLRKMVVTTVTGSQVVNMKDLESISGSIRLCFFWLSSQIHNYLRDYDTPVVFSQHCLTHFALPFMQDFLTGLARESAVNPEFIR